MVAKIVNPRTSGAAKRYAEGLLPANRQPPGNTARVQVRRHIWDAQAVYRLRLHLSMSQRQFANEVGTFQPHVSDWECGKQVPSGPAARVFDLLSLVYGFDVRSIEKTITELYIVG